MTPSEKAKWELQLCEARSVLREIEPTRQHLKKLTESYDRIFCRAANRFAEADERLASEDGRKKIITSKPLPKTSSAEDLLRNMNRDQILRLQALISSVKGGNLDEDREGDVLLKL